MYQLVRPAVMHMELLAVQRADNSQTACVFFRQRAAGPGEIFIDDAQVAPDVAELLAGGLADIAGRTLAPLK
jgi:hypothetical protein